MQLFAGIICKLTGSGLLSTFDAEFLLRDINILLEDSVRKLSREVMVLNPN